MQQPQLFNEHTRACAYCGDPLPPNTHGNRKYCNETCRHAPARVPCVQCGELFTPHHGRAYCSKRCHYDAANARQRERWRQSHSLQARRCDVCSTTFTPTHDRQRYCTIKCRRWRGYELSVARGADVRTARAKQRERQRILRRFGRTLKMLRKRAKAARQCEHCGRWFIPAQANGKRQSRFCSRSCSRPHYRSDARYRRRARSKGGVPVYRKRIAERDGWRCKICGKQVNKRAKVPHPSAPTLDHIVPLAAGGRHEPTNVQLAHFRCNRIKNATGSGQLLLFG